MKRTTISLLVAGLFFAAPHALAQLKVSGAVSGEVIGTDLNSRNGFRFEEYRDLRTGGSLSADVRGESDTYFLGFYGENLGRDDQFAELRGGKYGVLKYSLYNNNIVHNFTFDAITPYTGVGTNNLTFAAAPASTNTATWARFDYGIQHQNNGATFELQSIQNSPFYLRATANRKETKGIRPMGQSMAGPGGPMVELPTPVDYTTTDASAEVGYATRESQFSLNFSYSKFQDHLDTLTWRIPNATAGVNTDRSTLAADSDQWKLAANAVWKRLPMGSTLALRGTYSHLTNSLPVPRTFVSVAAGTGTQTTMNVSSPLFNGDVTYETFSASWTALPSRELDTRVYYNYNNKENDSTRVVFTPIVGTTGRCDIDPVTGLNVVPSSCTNEAFHYRKHNLGAELGYRVNSQNKLSGGWDYSDTTRERHDFEETKEHKVYVEWKNSSFELVSAKLKYQRIQRRSDFGFAGVNPAANANSFFNYYVKRFDLADNDQDLVKIVLDSTPAPLVDLGGEVIMKSNNYKTTFLGRSHDRREELYLTASYGDPKRFRINGFFDYEQTHYDSGHWQGTTNVGLVPTGGPPSTAFLWTGRVKDKNYVLGVGADWLYSGRLKFKGALIWQETDGSVDFMTNGVNVPVVPIGAYDSFRKNALNLSAVYALDKSFDLTVGAAYEHYKFDDVQMNGYRYTQSGTYLSGAYAFPSYNAKIGYLTLKYKFQ